MRHPAGAGQSHDDGAHPGPHGTASKKKSLIASEQNQQARANWQAAIATWSTDQVLFLDETSTHTSYTRTYGRAPHGQRVVDAVPRNHGPNISCLAALGPQGVCASLAIPGAVDGAVLQSWLAQQLLPRLVPGTTLVLDNLSVHRSAAVAQLVRDAGCHLRFLPTYSPDFNPIELTFARLKAHLRAVKARTFDEVVAAIGDSFKSVTSAHAAAWFQHCGYPRPDTAT